MKISWNLCSFALLVAAHAIVSAPVKPTKGMDKMVKLSAQMKSAAAAATKMQKASAAAQKKEEPEGDAISCGAVAKYDHAGPKNYEDSKPTKYVDGKHVKVTFKAGDTIPFECKKGYTVDGSKDGDREFDVECTENGYYKPSKTCIKASKCGAVPSIEHAHTTGKADGKSVQFACNQGYSLDGKKVIPGGFGKNEKFDLECDEFAGDYKKFEGECQAYGFMPTNKAIKLYNTVFEVLFTVDCQKQLQKKFGKDGTPPSDLGGCSSLAGDLKADFEKKKKEKEEHLKKGEKDWFEDEDVPGVSEEAKKFCEKCWKEVSFPPEF